MKILLIFLLFFCVSTFTLVYGADKCNTDDCALPDCRCSNTEQPIDTPPQLISLTFDEAVVDNLYVSFWEPLLFNRTNPDGKHISATFFVPHEYTDYSRVQELYLKGFEIGVNSITKNSLSEYWQTADVDTLKQEFDGQRTIISHFANIPKEDIIGVRTPQLQLQGDNSINAYTQSNLLYDSSWTSRSTSRMLPYTLDFNSTQECRTGTTCPVDEHPGFWILPIIDLQGNSTDGNILECNSLITCNQQGSADDIAEWLEEQINRVMSDNRAPQTIMVSSAWFRFTENSYEGFEKFLDKITSQNVYLVSQKQVYDWIKNPVSEADFKTEVPERSADCSKISCPLLNADNNLRYMTSCVPCPEIYPWLGNPLGLVDPDTTTTPTTTPVPTTTSNPTTTPVPTTTSNPTTTATTAAAN